MKKNLILSVFALLCISGKGQSIIQWHDLLYPSGEIKFLQSDSTQQIGAVYNARQFLYDSLQQISVSSGKSFFENIYVGEFKTPTFVNHIVIDFADATRLMYSIKLHDENSGVHTVYDYYAALPCEPGSQTVLLTIARTPYKVKKIEIGTFNQSKEFKRVGLSAEMDGNKVLQELVTLRMSSLCSRTSYLTEKTPMSAAINSASDEVKPIISTDGRTFFIHRQNDPASINKVKDEQDIYVSELKDGQWQEPVNIGAPLNDKMPNGVAAVSTGGNTLFLINEYLGPNKQTQGLSFSEKTLNGWSFPKKIEIDNFYNRSPYLDYHISPSQNEMILAVQRDDSFGDQDLYVSYYSDLTHTWTQPVNLGEQINTPLAEASPFLAADGKTLYFSSNGYLGYGGFDLYVTHRLDDSWTNWSTPENLGPVINSDDDDLYYTIAAAGDNAYFISTVNGSRDVFRIALPKIYKPEPVVLLSGKLISAIDLAPVEAEITFTWLGENETVTTAKSDASTGEYKAILPADALYNYEVKSPGHETVKGVISSLGLKKYQEKEQNLILQPSQSEAKTTIEMSLLAMEGEDAWTTKLKRLGVLGAAFPTSHLSILGTLTDSLKTGRFRSMKDIANYVADKGFPKHNIKTGDGHERSSVQLVVTLPSGKTNTSDSALIPAGYQNPHRDKADEIAFLVKGRVIDANTLKPAAAQLVFKTGEKVKSRTSSNPESGKYQAMLASGKGYDLKLYVNDKEHVFQYQAPDLKEYTEVEHVWLINKEGKPLRSEVGAGVSTNRNEKATRKWKKFLKKKKATKEILALKNDQQELPKRMQSDLEYLSDILKNIPGSSITLYMHTSSGMKDSEHLEENLAKRCSDSLVASGVNSSLIKVIKTGDREPKHKRPKHHTNTRVVAEITLP